MLGECVLAMEYGGSRKISREHATATRRRQAVKAALAGGNRSLLIMSEEEEKSCKYIKIISVEDVFVCLFVCSFVCVRARVYVSITL